MLTAWSKGEKLSFKANPSYWGGEPAVKKFTMAVIKDDDVRATRLRSGELDGAILPPNLAKAFAADKARRTYAAKTFDYRNVTLPTEHPVTGDTAVRQALDIAVDRATMVDKLLEGAGKAAYGPVPAGSPWFTAGTERLYDLAKAKKILDEAGWIPGADGIRSRNGVRAAFPLWYTSGDKICQDQALAFASDAKKAGIHVTAESGSWEVIESRMRTDAVLGGGGSPADPDFDQYLTLNSALTGDGFNNMARYDNPAVDKALLEGRRSGDPAVRKGAYDTVQRLPWGPMARMPGRRILFAGPVLLVVTFGVFAVAALSPFDPVKAYAGAAGLTASQAGLDQLRAHLGADQPLLERWWEWLASALTGDLGTSAVMRRPFFDVIGERLGWSALLALCAFAVAVLLGTGLGVLAARRQGGRLDRAVSGLAYTLEAAPAFWLGLLAIWFFSVRLGVLPSGGLSDAGSDVVAAGQVARHLALRALVLGISQRPWFFLCVRQGVADVLEEDPVRGARARGLGERRVLLGHGLRAGTLPMLTLIGSRVPELITGAAGGDRLQPARHRGGHRPGRDLGGLPVAGRADRLATAAVLAGNLLSDLLYGLADSKVGFDG